MPRSYRFLAAAVPGLQVAGATVSTVGDYTEVVFAAGDDWRAFDAALPAAPLEAGPELSELLTSVSLVELEVARTASTDREKATALDALLADADTRPTATATRTR